MDFATLTSGKTVDGSLKHWVNKSNIPSSSILSEAEAWLWNRLRLWEQVTVDSSLSTAVGQQVVALPLDFLEPIYFGIEGRLAGELSHRIAHDVESMIERDASGAPAEGRPDYYYLMGAGARLDRPADAVYPLKLIYYASLPPLSDSNPTNLLTMRYPRLLRCVCLAFANEWLKDNLERDRWLTLAAAEIGQINQQTERAQLAAYGGVPVLTY